MPGRYIGLMTTILTTARLHLREMQASDLDFIAEMMSHPEVMRFYPKLATRDEAAQSIVTNQRRYAEFGHGQWLLEELATGRPVGRCGLIMQTVDGEPIREVGYMLHRPFWKQGFAAEAAIATRDYGFRTFGSPFLISLIRPENHASAGVAKKMGMTPWKETLHFDLPHVVWRIDAPQG
jgi:RimJ/RimL family protein N-acetyltransferase